MVIRSCILLGIFVAIGTPMASLQVSALCGAVSFPDGSSHHLIAESPDSIRGVSPHYFDKILEHLSGKQLICTLPALNECNSNPCSNGSTCLNLDYQYECVCIPGITGVNCEINIDECASSPCLNGATCLDHINHYECWCFPGYVGVHCDTESSMAFITRKSSILAGSFSSNISLLEAQQVKLPLTIESARSTAYDPRDKLLYWADNYNISRATLNGTEKEVIFQDTDKVSDILLEFDARKIYWSQYLGSTIERANFNGTDYETIVSGRPYLYGLAIDNVNKFLFWKEQWLLWRCDLHGNNRMQLLSTVTSPGTPLFYYEREAYLIYLDNGIKQLRSVTSNGTDMQILIEWTSIPKHFSAHNGIVYFLSDDDELVEFSLSNASDARAVEGVRGIDKLYVPKNTRDFYVYYIDN